ncbi:MAG: RtcB family protein [Emcibacteraceae bacterium]|nr:RtcB family protein [Emcibacteraceae bacterium]
MAISYLVDEEHIPDDGTNNCLTDFIGQYKDAEILVFPDVHYKEGSRVVNGMLTCLGEKIIPEMLGVANCGFLFGTFTDTTLTENALIENAKKWSAQLKDYSRTALVSKEKAITMLLEHFKENLSAYASTRAILDLENDAHLEREIRSLLKNKYLLQGLLRGIGTLGGGNHFFELMKNEKSDFYFAIHSDSVLFGERVNNICSNLNEIKHNNMFIRIIKSMRIRYNQSRLFLNELRSISDIRELYKLVFSVKGDRGIKCTSPIGRKMLLLYLIAHAVGSINREQLLHAFTVINNDVKGPTITAQIMSNKSHDQLEVLNSGSIIQRNGVQEVNDELFYLPGALGTAAYIMRGLNNKKAYNSCNHGVGRLIPKSKVGKNQKDETTMSVLRVGHSDLYVQKATYFKDVTKVISQMEKYKTATAVSKLTPFLSIKG